MVDKFRLSATSALVQIWAGLDLYQTQMVREYLAYLDLSSGQELYERCNLVWQDYGSVIQNRKRCIKHWCKEILSESTTKQVVIIAAGFSPLGLELSEEFLDHIIFDTDVINMPKKQRLCEGIPGFGSNLKFVELDVLDIQRGLGALIAAGWDPKEPTLLIYEGLSYYVGAEVSRNIWKAFSHTESICIFEYMIPESAVALSHRYIPREVFKVIGDYCNIRSPMTTWTWEQLQNEPEIVVYQHTTMHAIEEEFYGKSVFFSKPEFGWIELARLNLHI